MENQIGKVFVFKNTEADSLRNKLGVIAHHWVTESGIHWYDTVCFNGKRVVDVRQEQIDILANDLNDFCEMALGHNPSEAFEYREEE
jgi:hypothetical protein